VVVGLIVSSSFAPTRIITNLDGGFAIDAQSFDAVDVSLCVFLKDVVENCVGLGQFFWGLALTTFRKR
jgi:hypothetical protein